MFTGLPAGMAGLFEFSAHWVMSNSAARATERFEQPVRLKSETASGWHRASGRSCRSPEHPAAVPSKNRRTIVVEEQARWWSPVRCSVFREQVSESKYGTKSKTGSVPASCSESAALI